MCRPIAVEPLVAEPVAETIDVRTFVADSLDVPEPVALRIFV